MILITILLILSFPAHAWSDWSTTERALFTASSAAMIADWATTRNAARHDWPGGTYEQNIVLGRYPHQDRVDIYFVTLLITNYFIADYLPGDHRKFYLSVRALTHADAARNNIEIGWKIRF